MRRFGSVLLSLCLALGSRPSFAGQDDRPPGGSAGNTPPPAPPPAPTYAPAPTPTFVPPTPPPPTYGGSVGGSVTVNPPAPVYVPPPSPPSGNAATAGLYQVYVRDEAPDLVHRISFTDGRPIATCTGNCTFSVPPGQYLIEVDGNDSLRGAKKVINVSGHTVVDVSPGSKSTRTTGLVLGIIGPVATIVGLFGALVVSVDNSDKDFRCRTGDACESKSDATAYLLLMVAGIGATTAGWIMFGTSSTKIRPSLGAPQMAPTVALGAVPTRHGATFGLTVHF